MSERSVMPLVPPKEISTPRSTVTAQTCELPSSARPGSSQTAEADADQGVAPTIRSHRVVVDLERNTCEISGLTGDDARAIAADVTARLAALKRRWEESRDLQALLGALIFCQLQLPDWLFKGLMQTFEQQFKNPDAIRFLAVRHAHDVLGKTLDDSYVGVRQHRRPHGSRWPRYHNEILPKNKIAGGGNRSHPTAATYP